jgi:hypothetical protein
MEKGVLNAKSLLNGPHGDPKSPKCRCLCDLDYSS